MKWRLDGGQIEVLDEALADVLRRKTPAEKIRMIGAAHRTARQLIRAGVRHEHPDWDVILATITQASVIGFDEIYVSSQAFSAPKPDQLLLSCRTIENVGLGPESVRWLEENECLLGLGDGFVLNVLIGYRTTSTTQPAVHLPVFGTFVSLA